MHDQHAHTGEEADPLAPGGEPDMNHATTKKEPTMTSPTEKVDEASPLATVSTMPDAGGRPSEPNDEQSTRPEPTEPTTGQDPAPSPDAQAVDAERRADEAEARATAAEQRALVAMRIEAGLAHGIPVKHAHRLEGTTYDELAADAATLADEMRDTWWPTPQPRLRRPPSSLPFERLTHTDDDDDPVPPLPARNGHVVTPPRRRGWRAPHREDGAL